MDVQQPEPADVIALLRAHLRGDEHAINSLLSVLNTDALLAMVVGALLRILDNAGMDAAALDAELSRWQVEHR